MSKEFMNHPRVHDPVAQLVFDPLYCFLLIQNTSEYRKAFPA
jgi:hypothetical protein